MAQWSPAQKRLAIEMLEKHDAFGFHASLNTEHDNDWTILEAEAGGREEQASDPGEAVYERVSELVRAKQLADALSLLRAEAAKAEMQGSRSMILAEALCLREQGNLRPAWRLQAALR